MSHNQDESTQNSSSEDPLSDREKLRQMEKSQKYLLLGGLLAIGSSILKYAGLFSVGFLPPWLGLVLGGFCLAQYAAVAARLSGRA